MKELYIAPELELLALAPTEGIANDEPGDVIDFDAVLGAGEKVIISNTDTDLDVDLDNFGL